MRKKILIIDDDIELNNLLSDFLDKYNYQVITATHPDIGLDLLKRHEPDLIVLDIMMPDKNGFEVCKEIREAKFQTPIIILSARGDFNDKVAGLDLGADDYMPKPYEPRELVARIQSVLRRAEGPKLNLNDVKVLKSHGLVVDLNRATVHHDDRPLELTTMEFEILTLFMQNPGRDPFSRTGRR